MQAFQIILLSLQLALFLLGRILDDMSWYDVGVANEVNVFEGIGVAGMTIAAVCQVLRKKHIDGWWKILFIRSQFKFVISWALITTICYLFFNIFGCEKTLPETDLVYFYVTFQGCCINITQYLLTNLNFSLICNTKAHLAELIVYELVLFGEIIYNGKLLILFVNNLSEKPKDYSILLISIVIANQILMMDLIFRAAYEDRQREEEKEEKMLGHKIVTQLVSSMPQVKASFSGSLVQLSSMGAIEQTPLNKK